METSYKVIFGTHKGNLIQRLLKFWIMPRMPRLEILVYTLLGVGIFKRVLMNTIGRIDKYSSHQTNYNIGKLNLKNLLTFATSQTMFNEGWHLFAFLATNLPYLITWWNDGRPLSATTVFFLVLSVINIYCVMLQRYNRARICLVVERLVSKGHTVDSSYRNWLALDLPDPVDENERLMKEYGLTHIYVGRSPQ
ncbi:MAG: hypothetical protein UW26_C0008G0005 [Candidatus Collierbacteria bacterium GW2011_GWF1_44_12]|uniref:Glycosyl-4,4'-diaponeurosporenoate acyltransferase n=1 Tax=Candidatus Collierbacteria bacterium GW2011_GWF1_44_12 TaxID=1618402 RepID=A0A0G1GY08_9BACT|nr:MAG: hypothetical protein UW26_C0008G0005 [Candidatus Collierbacteria bacterium GW2011_GWF1_44_12]